MPTTLRLTLRDEAEKFLRTLAHDGLPVGEVIAKALRMLQLAWPARRFALLDEHGAPSRIIGLTPSGRQTMSSPPRPEREPERIGLPIGLTRSDLCRICKLLETHRDHLQEIIPNTEDGTLRQHLIVERGNLISTLDKICLAIYAMEHPRVHAPPHPEGEGKEK